MSLMPRSRLSSDWERSPPVETSTSTPPIATATGQGRSSARVPTAGTAAVPSSRDPANPSQLFFGLIRGAIGCVPNSTPATYPPMSLPTGPSTASSTSIAPSSRANSSSRKQPRNGTQARANTPPATSRSALRPIDSLTRHRMSTHTAAAVATSSPSAPNTTVETTIPITPTSSGTAGSCRPPWARARVSSRTARDIAIAATTGKACGTTNTAPTRRISRAAPTAIAAGRLRPAPRLLACSSGGSGAATTASSVLEAVVVSDSAGSVLIRPPRRFGVCDAGFCAPGSGSDRLELGLLEAERLGALIVVLLGERLELLLRPGARVLAALLVLAQLLDRLLRGAARAAHGDAAVLGLGARELHVVLAALLGEGGQHHAQVVAVVGGVHAQVRVAQRGLDAGHRGLVVGGDDDGARLGELEGGQLVQRRGGTVVLDGDALEHRGVRAAGADRGELVLGDLHGLLHLGLGVLQDARDVVTHRMLLGSGWVFVVHCPAPSRSCGRAAVPGGGAGVEDGAGPAPSSAGQRVTTVPMRSPRMARVMLPGRSRPNTIIGWALSMQRLKAVESTTFRPRLRASS